MAGKNAYLRYRIIDECLNRNKLYDYNDLMDSIFNKLGVHVSKSTLDKDLKTMRDEFDAPIIWDNKVKKYRYERKFSMTGLTLSDKEKDVLNMSLAALNIFKDTDYGQSFKSLFERLSVRAKDLPEEKQIIEWESPHEFLGSKWFDILVKSIVENQTLIISYEPYDKTEKDFVVSPYMIKEYRNRFYLVGKIHDKNDEIRIMGLDRIRNVVTSKEKYKISRDFDTKEFFRHSIGIIRKPKEAPLKFKLKVNSEDAHYIISDPWHQSQKIVEQTNDYLIFSLEVYDTPELDLKIRSYGAEIEVLEPDSYRKKMKETAERMLEIYKK